MTSAQVVCNSSPLIALDRIGHLDLLERVFGSVLVPPAVVLQITPALVPPAWITARSLTQPLGSQLLGTSLGPGESEAIALALEIGATWVVLDDRSGAKAGESAGTSRDRHPWHPA